MTTNDNVFLAKTSHKFFCESCDYSTSKKFNFDIHLDSKKHKNNVLTTNNNDFLAKTSKKYECENCEKSFNDRAGLWRHSKKCKIEQKISKNSTPEISQDLILSILKQNSDFQQTIMEQNKTIIELSKSAGTNHSHNTTNSHNKSFNLQFFLNETCKDAMNITDFVDSIKLQLSDLERVGEMGYIEGISNIITKNLKALDVTQRPIHCTDKKREVLYVKDEDKWEKEDDTKNKIRKAIKKVSSKNQRLLPEFKKEHPDCIKASSKFSDQYNKIIVESMGGSGDDDFEKENKIIKNITKVTTID
jgi:ribosomal protein L37AE/L43A